MNFFSKNTKMRYLSFLDYNVDMARKDKKCDLSALNGLSIYHDSKRTVYSPFFSKKGYILTENNVEEYISYIQGYLIAMMIFLVVQIFYKRIWLSVSLTVVFLASSVFMFYKNFISKSAIIEDYKKPKREGFVERQARSLETKNIWTIILCSPLLAAMIMLNSYLNHNEGALFYLMAAISLVALFYGILHIYVLIYKKKHM